MSAMVNIIFSLDGSNIKDDVVKRIKEGSDGIEEVRICSLGERLNDNQTNTSDVNVLLVTPSMRGEVDKYADKDFRLLFPNIDKSLVLVCDSDSERHIERVISRSVDYSKICQFNKGNAREWKYIMIPTIKQMASQEDEEPSIPDINRYIIRPKIIDSSVDEVCVIFLDEVGPKQPVKIFIGNKVTSTSQLSRGVYVFSSQDMPAGVHNVKVTVGDSDYGSTTLKIQSDIDKLKNVFHGAVQKDPLQLLSLLLGSHSMDKEDIERDIIDILQEKPFNTAFLNLIERLLRLQPTDGSPNKEEKNCYPTLLHFCAANGMSSVSKWLLYNIPDDKRSWKNSEGLTPAQIAERENYVDLQKLLDPDSPLAGPPVASRHGLISVDSDDDEIFLPSPLSPGCRRTSVPSSFHSDWGSDSGRSSYSSGTGSSAASFKPDRRQSDSIPVKSFAKPTRLYETIDDDSLPVTPVRLSSTLPNKKYDFKNRAHTYSEIDDLQSDSVVQLRPEKDPPYEEAWENNPIPDKLPIKPAVPKEKRPDSAVQVPRSLSFPKGLESKSKSLPRGGSLDGMSGNTRL